MEEDENIVEVKCVVCQSSSYETLFKVGKNNEPINFSICCDCGLSYLNPRWTKSAYDEYYATEYDGNYREVELTPDLNSKKYKNIKIVLKRLGESDISISPNMVLDIGSGMGWSSLYLKNEVFPSATYFAIEPSIHCMNNLNKIGIEVLTDDVDSEWQKGEKKFDLIIMRHVLEHFMNPVEVLKKVSQSLSENGVLYVAVPNTRQPGRPVEETFLRVVHTYYFTPKSIMNCFRLAGLKPVAIIENDDDNPYELFAFVTKSDVANAVIDASEFGLTKESLEMAIKEGNSTIGSLKVKVKRRLRKLGLSFSLHH